MKASETFVNRCPHVGGPEWAGTGDCGCALDFACPHGGKCETEKECIALDEEEGLWSTGGARAHKVSNTVIESVRNSAIDLFL